MAKLSPKPAAKEHIVFCGPIGVGKSTLSRPFASKTGLAVFSLDRLRNLSHIPLIHSEIESIRKELLETDKALLREFDPEKFAALKKDRNSLREDLEMWEAQLQLREDPRIGDSFKNYDDMGYDFRLVCKMMDIAKENGMDKHIAWHYYQKYFEIQMIKQIAAQLDEKAIIDLGGGMPVVLVDEYLAFEHLLEGMGKEGRDILAAMPMRAKDMLKATREAMSAFDKSKVVSLHLSPTYSEREIDGKPNPDYNDKAARCTLNPKFIETAQYDEVAGIVIETQGIVKFVDGYPQLNAEAGWAAAARILEQTSTPIETKALDM